MRVTTKSLSDGMLNVLNKRYGDLVDLQEQLSTGKRLRRPSDDPIDVANTLRLTTSQSKLNQYHENIEDSMSYMAIADSAMASMNTLIQRSRELAIQASSDTLSDQERVYINKETEQLTRQLVALVNTQYRGDYVFGGQQTKIAPLSIESSSASTVEDYDNFRMAYFNADGLPVGSTVQLFEGFSGEVVTNIIPGTFSLSVGGTAYVENSDYTIDYEAGTITILNGALALDVTPGSANYDISQVAISFDSIQPGENVYGQTISNRGVIERQIEDGVSMQINIGMDEMVTDPISGIDLFGTLIRFGAALEHNDRTNIATAIDELDLGLDAVLNAQSKNGARINRLETTLTRNENQYTEATSQRSELEDAEMAETASKFALAQTVYNASLQTMAKVIQLSLADYL